MCTRTPRAGAIIAIAALLTMSRKSISKDCASGVRFRQRWLQSPPRAGA
jgi:hypothetical protein